MSSLGVFFLRRRVCLSLFLLLLSFLCTLLFIFYTLTYVALTTDFIPASRTSVSTILTMPPPAPPHRVRPTFPRTTPACSQRITPVHLTPSDVKRLQGDDFRVVLENRPSLFLYSAYLDRRLKNTSPVVRLIGATASYVGKTTDLGLSCILNYELVPPSDNHQQGILLNQVPAPLRVQRIREWHGYSHSAYFFFCPLPKVAPGGVVNGSAAVPRYVSILSNPCHAQPHVLMVRDQEPVGKWERSEDEHNVSVCIKPLYGPYNQQQSLIEFLEFYSLLGVKHFTFYNGSVSPEVDKTLQLYISEGRAEVLPWTLPLRSRVDIHTEGLLISLNDCLYRNMFKYKYVAFVDIDEFIIPRKQNTLPDMLRFLNFTPAVGGMLFRNSFFYLSWTDDSSMSSIEPRLVTLIKTLRSAFVFKAKVRSKLVVKPETVLEMGNHFTWQYLAGYKERVVPANIALSQHYRQCEKETNCTMKKKDGRDRTTHRFKEMLLQRTRQRLKQLQLS